MAILPWLVLGLVFALAAWWSLPGRDPAGLVLTTLISVGLAILGGWIASQLGFGSVTNLQLSSAVIALLAGLVLLMMRRLVRSGGR
jgi:uncharacterized membrane protein YeaQ/YmgE (transglycosylase-associated protein family)